MNKPHDLENQIVTVMQKGLKIKKDRLIKGGKNQDIFDDYFNDVVTIVTKITTTWFNDVIELKELLNEKESR